MVDCPTCLPSETAWGSHSRIAFAAVGTFLLDTTGEGPDLIFLHAGIADRTMWQPQVEAFSDRFRCTTPDARGFGDTPIGGQLLAADGVIWVAAGDETVTRIDEG